MKLVLPAFARTTTFRLTLLSAVVFAASAALVLIYIYASLQNTMARRVDAEIAEEVDALTDAYDTRGINGLNQAVIERTLKDGPLLYVLTARGALRSGNLDGVPAAAPDEGLVTRFTYMRETEDGPEEARFARGYVKSFPGEFQLLVARDVDDDARYLNGVANTAWTATGMVLLLALSSGIFVSRRFARRLERLNDVVRFVSAGDLRKRAARTNTGDELDELSGNLNTMLDRIEHLMAAMRHAGDSIAHDLRSPITRLRNRLETAAIDARDDEDRCTIDAAVSDVNELLTTFDAVMRIARLEAGEKRPALASLDAGALVHDIGELYEPACEDKLLSLTVETAANLAVLADRALLSQAVANLLDNAIKYTPEGGAVALRARLTSGGQVEVSVTDTGPGIPEADRDRVRQRFVRLDASRTAPGSGLGLSLVQAVAGIHNGDLVLDDGPGEVDGRGPGLRAALVLEAVKHAEPPIGDAETERRNDAGAPFNAVSTSPQGRPNDETKHSSHSER